MKLFQLSILALAIFAFGACGDDEGDCVQTDWVGTYSGVYTCDGFPDSVDVTITASGSDKIIILYESTDIDVEFDPLAFKACKLDVSESSGAASLSVDGELDGDRLTITDVLTVSASASTCKLVATRN